MAGRTLSRRGVRDGHAHWHNGGCAPTFAARVLIARMARAATCDGRGVDRWPGRPPNTGAGTVRLLTATVLVMGLLMPLGSAAVGPGDVNALPASAPSATSHYGSDALQFGELRLPAGTGPFPVAIIVHGGCWTRGFATLRMTAPIASALAARGVATWNIEYRQMGDAGGGWPGTFRDWGAATDHLRRLAREHPLDLTHVAVVGHSAGAHAALWIAARERLRRQRDIGAAQPLPIRLAFAIDGPADLEALVGPDAQICGKPVIAPFMGGTPQQQPARYRQASPQRLLATSAKQFLIASAVLTAEQARGYATRIGQRGGNAQVLELPVGHFEVIAPGQREWATIEDLIVTSLRDDHARRGD